MSSTLRILSSVLMPVLSLKKLNVRVCFFLGESVIFSGITLFEMS